MSLTAFSVGSASSPGQAVPAIAVVGYANCGKTTLICRLLTLANSQGLRVAAVKHSHKALEPEPAGKDTWRFRQAGAQTVVLAGPGLLQVNHTLKADPPLSMVLAALPQDLDLIFIEGYKHSDLPKLVFISPAAASLSGLSNIIAYISDTPIETRLPVFSREAAAAILAFLLSWRQC